MFAAAYALLWQERDALAEQNVSASYRLEWLPCETFTSGGARDIDCARLFTPGEQFALDVAVLRYKAADKQVAPVLYLQGGPGLQIGLDTSSLARWRSFRDYAGLTRDLILLNRRGTGPRASWQCPAYEALGHRLLEQHLSLEQEWARGRQALDACLAGLTNFNPLNVGTRASAEDIHALVALLSLDAWHLVGVSYGSRLALTLADAPGLESMVLDSVYPPGKGGVAVWPETLATALGRFPSACQSQPACAQQWQRRFPGEALEPSSFLTVLHSLLDELARMPMRVDVKIDGLPRRVLVNDHRFLAAVFAATYQHNRWAALVEALADARQRERPGVAVLMQRFVGQALSDSVNTLTFLAVDCRDNPVGEGERYRQQVARYPELVPYTESLWRDQICHQWPAAEPPVQPDLKGSEVRVTLLSGEFDPITPPEWSAELKRRYPALQRSEFPATGHHVLGARPCALAQLEDFISARRESIEPCAE